MTFQIIAVEAQQALSVKIGGDAARVATRCAPIHLRAQLHEAATLGEEGSNVLASRLLWCRHSKGDLNQLDLIAHLLLEAIHKRRRCVDRGPGACIQQGLQTADVIVVRVGQDDCLDGSGIHIQLSHVIQEN